MKVIGWLRSDRRGQGKGTATQRSASFFFFRPVARRNVYYELRAKRQPVRAPQISLRAAELCRAAPLSLHSWLHS
jgi:hypothetical protein